MHASGRPAVADDDEDPNTELRPFSSPPCYAHEVDPAYFGLPAAGETAQLDALRRALHHVEAAVAALSHATARR